jgi:hypothetical protein
MILRTDCRTVGIAIFVALRGVCAIGYEQSTSDPQAAPASPIERPEISQPIASRIDPDRPHLPEASTAVGKGRVVFEGGYTSADGVAGSQTYPELLLRAGLFSDRFEVRVGETLLRKRLTDGSLLSTARGAGDLYVGVKVALEKAHGLLPALAVIPQMTIPTGSATVTADRMLPGVNIDASWEIVRDRDSVELVVGSNRTVDTVRRPSFEVATGVTNAFQISRDVEVFAEWDAFVPTVGNDASRYYAVSGAVYFLTKNVAVDFRLGAGLNTAASPFVIGAGFAIRP